MDMYQFADRYAVLAALEDNTHSFFSPDQANAFTRPFGFDCLTEVVQANPDDPKGLTLANGAREAEGASARDVAEQICRYLDLRYPTMMGRGFQVRACCDVIRHHLLNSTDAQPSEPTPGG